MELEYFVKPGEDEKWHEYWLEQRWKWYVDLGIKPENLRKFEHPKEKLSHYAKRTVDIEYKFEFAGSEWAELEGVANRTDYDLKTHSQASGTDLNFFDQENNEKYIPYVIEPSAGLTRAVLAFLLDAYDEDEAPTMLCQDKDKNDVVKDIIAKLKEIEVDGETMEYILDQVGMLDQVAKQLGLVNF
jgi:glycyl-tRNA synthetase